MMKAMADDSPAIVQEAPHARQLPAAAVALDVKQQEDMERQQLEWALQASLAENGSIAKHANAEATASEPNVAAVGISRARLQEAEARAQRAEEALSSHNDPMAAQLSESEALAGRLSLELHEAKTSI